MQELQKFRAPSSLVTGTGYETLTISDGMPQTTCLAVANTPSSNRLSRKRSIADFYNSLIVKKNDSRLLFCFSSPQ
ncbi:hypothetical protein [Collimonas silvisoli]|uniref:hypothetical protein n=1 Tax=Collimonas silvisoli TaxID=2825884 RepID=UPI001B8D88C8|nr:hypothetical protein [Collimonas silvisoli]